MNENNNLGNLFYLANSEIMSNMEEELFFFNAMHLDSVNLDGVTVDVENLLGEL